MAEGDLDDQLRAAAFAYLNRLRTHDGDRISYRDLEAFEFEGQRVPLIQRMRGIRVGSGLEAALSLLTTYAARPQDRPYEDTEGPDGYWRYKWRGTDPEGYDNVALRPAMELGKPLVWFVGAESGVYVPIYPVWLGEEPAEHQLVLALDEEMRAQWESATVFHPADLALRRQYAQATVRRGDPMGSGCKSIGLAKGCAAESVQDWRPCRAACDTIVMGTSLAIPSQLNTALRRSARAESAQEASKWLESTGGVGELRVYEHPKALLPSGYAVGIRKPGKDADPTRARPIPYDMLPVVWTDDSPQPFDAGFNDICRGLWDLGQASRMSRSEDAACILGALLFRDAWFLDHGQEGGGKLRYAPPQEVLMPLASLPTTRIETPSATIDMPASVFLILLEILALTEDTKYWFLASHKITGATGRPNTLLTCARALACGLGFEHPMDFAYALMRGRGVAHLTRQRALTYFSVLGG